MPKATRNGSFTPFDVPGTSVTTAFGINDAGRIVGAFNTGTHAFLYTGGQYTELAVPGATSTAAAGINDAGQIVGLFFDSTGEHGFLATPVPEPATVTLLGIGLTLTGLALLRRRATSPKPH